jgi:hypothetical protein
VNADNTVGSFSAEYRNPSRRRRNLFQCLGFILLAKGAHEVVGWDETEVEKRNNLSSAPCVWVIFLHSTPYTCIHSPYITLRSKLFIILLHWHGPLVLHSNYEWPSKTGALRTESLYHRSVIRIWTSFYFPRSRRRVPVEVNLNFNT